MKTPTRILVGGPEVTSAFVLMGLGAARAKDGRCQGGFRRVGNPAALEAVLWRIRNAATRL